MREKIAKLWNASRLKVAQDKLHLNPSDVVLDAGCGRGDLARSISGRCELVYAIDTCVESNYRNEVAFIRASVYDFGDYELFDKIICTEVLEHLSNPQRAIENFYRILKPQGELFITTPNYASLWIIIEWFINTFNLSSSMKTHSTRFTPKKLRELLADFEIIEFGTFNWRNLLYVRCRK